MISKFLWLAAAGAAGTFARYGLSGAVQKGLGASFPYGTLAVNLTGCFLAGLLWAAMERHIRITPEIRTTLFAGFMGAFTTFSTYMLETGEMVRASQWAHAALNMALHNGAGFLVFFGGMAVAKML